MEDIEEEEDEMRNEEEEELQKVGKQEGGKRKKANEEEEERKYESRNFCAVCEKIEPPIDIKCSKFCKRCVHFNCIEVSAADLKALKEGSMQWQCSDCEKSLAECFLCKKQGRIMEKNSIKIEKVDNACSKKKPLIKCG